MKKRSLFFPTLLCTTLTFTACKDDKGVPPPPASGTFTVRAPVFDRWTYFSFEQSDTIQTDGSYTALADSRSWDLAFHRGDIRTNGGASGPGRGGAFKTEAVEMSAVTENPAEVTYTPDVRAEITFPTMRETADQSRNEVLADWYTSSGMPPTYVVHPDIYLIRTAEGKYAKVKFLDYTNDLGAGGYITFTYEYPVE